jgi:hypothetical protein
MRHSIVFMKNISWEMICIYNNAGMTGKEFRPILANWSKPGISTK